MNGETSRNSSSQGLPPQTTSDPCGVKSGHLSKQSHRYLKNMSLDRGMVEIKGLEYTYLVKH